MEPKYCSIGIVHYAKVDDHGTEGKDRSEVMKESLLSLFENTDYPAEIIVMDNGGSTDDTDWLVDRVREGKINTLVRYKENMSFAFAWNQFFRMATGDYVCFSCNDIKFKKGWLTQTIAGLEKYPDRKLIAAPYITPDKDRPNFNKEVLEDKYRINSMAGSNCMVMKPESFREIGQIPQHRIGGSIWHRMMVGKGYLVIVPPVDMVEHIAWRAGVNWRKPIKVERTLLDNSIINFHYANYRHNVKKGHQKDAGIPLP